MALDLALVYFGIGFLAGALVVFTIKRSKETSLREELASAKTALNIIENDHKEIKGKLLEKEETLAALQKTLGELEQKTLDDAEQIKFLKETEERLKEAFKALSLENLQKLSETLSKQNEEKYKDKKEAIESIVKPLSESLIRMDKKIEELEQKRVEIETRVSEDIKHLSTLQKELKGETQKIANALATPIARGKWGEIQLRRCIELTGMVNYCDFVEQAQFSSNGQVRRPDVIVKLPSNRCIAIDAKANLSHYLEAVEENDEARRAEKLKKHAMELAQQVKKLSAKEYWRQFGNNTPELVILFVPGENYYSAALAADPGLIETSANNKVLIANPMTLIGLLRATAFCWRQEELGKRYEEIVSIGHELNEKLLRFLDYFKEIGRHLSHTVKSYNKAVSSYDRRLSSSTEKLNALCPASSTKLTPENVAPEAIDQAVVELKKV
ncbi:MAG: DNA recombination protein RmuC [Candidatus Dadabacteria bacterium]|nr:MAG: DNA recombination protein RmuC [Candidatus Dadabacteria bacterium]